MQLNGCDSMKNRSSSVVACSYTSLRHSICINANVVHKNDNEFNDTNKTHVSPVCWIFTFIMGLSVMFQSFLPRK